MAHEEQELVKYYESAQLSDQQTQQLLAAGQLAASARKWRRLAVATSIALLSVTLVTGWLLIRNQQYRAMFSPENKPAVPSSPEITPEPPANAPDGPSAEDERSDFRFVAFRSHDDRCPHCRATGDLYAKLHDQLDEDGIEFEKFELQNQDQLPETMDRIAEQQLTSLVAGRNETAFAVLLSPQGTELQRFQSSDPIERVREAVREVIDQ